MENQEYKMVVGEDGTGVHVSHRANGPRRVSAGRVQTQQEGSNPHFDSNCGTPDAWCCGAPTESVSSLLTPSPPRQVTALRVAKGSTLDSARGLLPRTRTPTPGLGVLLRVNCCRTRRRMANEARNVAGGGLKRIIQGSKRPCRRVKTMCACRSKGRESSLRSLVVATW